MLFPPPAQRATGLPAEDWRSVAFGMAPILAGLAVPWLEWASFGFVRSSELAAAALFATLCYLRMVWQIGAHEQAARRRLGRRYVPPSTEITCVVCIGLIVTMVAPGLSAMALVDAVGLPRAAGIVQSYDASAMAATGATLDVAGVAPGGGPLVLAPDGNAHVMSLRTRLALPYALSWQAKEGSVCVVLDDIVGDACMSLDRRSGRLRDGERDVGRVTGIGVP
jgi:hypothetical protein